MKSADKVHEGGHLLREGVMLNGAQDRSSDSSPPPLNLSPRVLILTFLLPSVDGRTKECFRLRARHRSGDGVLMRARHRRSHPVRHEPLDDVAHLSGKLSPCGHLKKRITACDKWEKMGCDKGAKNGLL